MNWDQIEGKWDQLRGQIKSKWGKLTDSDLVTAEGKRDVLVGKIQERYGCMKDEAERQIDEWLGNIKTGSNSNPKRDRRDSVS